MTSLTYLLLPFMWCSLPFLCLQLVFSKSSIFQFLCQEIPVQSIWKKEKKKLKHTSCTCTFNIQVQHLASIWHFCSEVIIWNPIRDTWMDVTRFNSYLWRSNENAWKKAIKFFRGYGTKGLWKNGKTKYQPNSYQRKHKKSRDLVWVCSIANLG